MTLHLHHVFICTSVGGSEADALLNAGLVEGTPNTHPGQGTANRRFFFERGFLELIWVHDEREAQSPLRAATSLWDRWAGRGSIANPFGICFSSPQGVDSGLPFPSWKYRPDYLPDGRCYATEIAAALTAFALASPDVNVVRAHTLPSGKASQKVLAKCGFQRVGEVVDPDDGLVWRFEKKV